MLHRGAILLDVRNPDEVRRLAIPGALNIPLGDLSAGPVDALPTDRATPIVTLCARGKRSIYAMLLLKAQGYHQVRSVFGGAQAWVDSGLPAQMEP